MSLIILSCEDHILHLDPDELAATAWKKLQKQYGKVGFSARHLAFQSLVSTQLSCESVDHFIDQFRSHVKTLTRITTSPLPQWLLMSILINNAGSQYEAWSQSIMQHVRLKSISEDSNYLEEIIASLIDEARRMSHETLFDSNTALTARNNQKQNPLCIHCGRIHKSDNCWEKYPEKRPSARLSCSQVVSNITDDNNSTNGIAFFSQQNNNLNDSWIMDSGASQHMCNDQSEFSNFEPFTTTITIANNTNMIANGKGNVDIWTTNGKTFTLLNVLFVPQLASNLFSISYAIKNPNIKFSFTNGGCQILHGNIILANATTKDSLLRLETKGAYALTAQTTITPPRNKTINRDNNFHNSANVNKSPTKTFFNNSNKIILTFYPSQ